MAIIKFGALIAGLRGTISGVTYTANKAGPFARIWSRGSNPRSTLQSDARIALSSLAAQWRSIDPSDQADWNTWAADPDQELTNALGETYYISGFAWWVKMSNWLTTVSRSPITTAPTDSKPVAPTIASLVVSAGAVASEITYAAGTFTPDFDCVILLALAQSIGAYSTPGPPVLITAQQVPAGTSLDISDDIAARLGTPIVGQKAFAFVYRQNLEGYRSAPTSLTASVIA